MAMQFRSMLVTLIASLGQRDRLHGSAWPLTPPQRNDPEVYELRGKSGSMPFRYCQVNNAPARCAPLQGNAWRQTVKCLMRCFQEGQNWPPIGSAQGFRQCPNHGEYVGLKLPLRHLEAPTQMRHSNTTATLDPSVDRDAGRSAQFGSFIGRNHVRSVDALTPVLDTTAQQYRGLRLTGVDL